MGLEGEAGTEERQKLDEGVRRKHPSSGKGKGKSRTARERVIPGRHPGKFKIEWALVRPEGQGEAWILTVIWGERQARASYNVTRMVPIEEEDEGTIER